MSVAELEPDRTAEVVVETAHGKLRGRCSDGIYAFKGVRYAAPPVGEGRFQAPRPAESWSGVRDALAFGPQSPQPATGDTYRSPPPKEQARDKPRLPNILRTLQPLPPQETDEDCLFLNVWTPGVGDGAKRPVLVWCHGGGFTTGSGSWVWYDGANMARRGDVVVVNLNHRLGAVGYLYLKELAGERYAASGNAGMLDIVEALRWVRENIEAFGGDPDCVTVFGQSGGGGKVCNLLAMPAAKGLFHRAIVQSGPILRGQSTDQATAVARAVLEVLGVPENQAHRLQDVPWRDLVDAQREPAVMRVGRLGGFAPVMEGDILPAHPFDPAAPAISADVPVMVGYTAYEATFLQGMADRRTFALDEAGLRTRLEAILKDKAGEAIELYRRLNPEMTPSEVFFRITTDQSMGMGSVWLAERKHAQGRAPAFFYKFTWDCPYDDYAYRSSHNFEMPFVFANIAHTPAATPDTPQTRALSDVMCDAWTAFARHGDPNHAGMPAWAPYDPSRRATLIFDLECRAEDDPDAETRAWWERSGAAKGLGD